MSKIIKFIPQIYMITCMTLSVTFVHYMLGHSQNFWGAWAMGLIIAAPLALLFSSQIPKIMKKLSNGAPRP